MTRGGRVRGLTTAADMWVTAAIGLLIGAGFYFLAISATVATIVVLVPLKWFQTRFAAGDSNLQERDTSERDQGDGDAV